MADRFRFERILVAYDGSRDATRAVLVGGELAKMFGSSLTVVHVFSPPSAAYGSVAGMPAPDFTELEDASKDRARTVLDKGVKAARDAGAASTGKLIESESAVQAIVEYAAKAKADLIVAGTRGRTGFRRLVLGSVSSGLVAHASCPVLVVR